jgi:hypothetical protein
LQGACVGALVGKLKAAGMPEHVWVRLKADLGRDERLAISSPTERLTRSISLRSELTGANYDAPARCGRMRWSFFRARRWPW